MPANCLRRIASKIPIMPANCLRRIGYWMPIDRKKFEAPLVE